MRCKELGVEPFIARYAELSALSVALGGGTILTTRKVIC